MNNWKLNLNPGMFLVVPFYGKNGRLRKKKVPLGWYYAALKNEVKIRRPTLAEVHERFAQTNYLLTLVR